MPPPPPPWADLPGEILIEIASRLTDIAELTCFSSVCTSWGSAAAATTLPPGAPWIILRDCRLFSIDGQRSYRFPSPAAAAALGFFSHKEIYASSGGYILAIDESDSSLSLANPFDGDVHHLPPSPINLGSFHAFDVSPHGVIVLDGAPTVKSRYNGWKRGPWFCRPGDACWSHIPNIELSSTVATVIYNNGKFLLFDIVGALSFHVIELDAASLLTVPAVVKVQPPVVDGVSQEDTEEDFEEDTEGDFVVAAGGEGVMIWFCLDVEEKRFFRAEYRSEETEWAEVDGLGDHALFCGLPALRVDAAASEWKIRRAVFEVICSSAEWNAMTCNAAVQQLAMLNSRKQLGSRVTPTELCDIMLPLYKITGTEWMMPPSRLIGIRHRNHIATSSGRTMRRGTSTT